MALQMKLRQQGFVLIAVPLIFEIFFVGRLWFMLSDMEKSLKEVAVANEIVTTSNDVLRNLSAYYVSLASVAATGHLIGQTDNPLRMSSGGIERLRSLVAGDQNMLAVVNHAEAGFDRLEVLTKELARGYDADDCRFYCARFLDPSEERSALRATFRSLGEDSRLLSEYYNSKIQVLAPEAVRARSSARSLITLGVICNILIAVALALIFTRSSARRLETLMKNIERFKTEQPLLPPLQGKDELAVLDDAFRQMAAARRRAEQLRQELMAMVSHDLRSPLFSISGIFTLAVSNVYGQMTDQLRKVLGVCDSEMHRLIRLANDLLDIEKVESGGLELAISTCDVQGLAEEALNAVQGQAEHDEVMISVDVEPEMELRCDPDRIIQVLVNLLSNAIKFSTKGQTVQLKCYHQVDSGAAEAAGADDLADPAGSHNQVCAVFEVTDNGPGIAPELQSKVFERFKQLAQSDQTRRAGSGLGLAICQALVEKHGGTIGVTSEPGQGSCFWVRLPETVND